MIIVMSTVVIQAGAETTMKEPLSLNKCAAHAAEAKNKEKMIPATMALEEMAKAIPAVIKRKKMTTQVATVMLVHVSTLTSILLEK